MRIMRVGVGCSNDFAEQNECWLGEVIFFRNRIERYIFAVMAEFAVRNIEYDSVIDLCPVSVVWQEDKLRVSIDKFFDKPWAGHAIHFNFLASDPPHRLDSHVVAPWFWYAVVGAVLYGAHQIFTRLAAERIGEGLGGFVVEASAALSILLYLVFLWLNGRWNQKFSASGFNYSLLTGICVGAGTIAFFLLFQRGGPLSAVPGILAGGAAIMAASGILWFGEPLRPARLVGIALALIGLYLVR